MSRSETLLRAIQKQLNLKRDPRRARNWLVITVVLALWALWSGSIMLSVAVLCAFLRLTFLLTRWQDNVQRRWEWQQGINGHVG